MTASAVSRVAGMRRNFEGTNRFKYDCDVDEISEGEGEGVRDEVKDRPDTRREFECCDTLKYVQF